MSIKKVRTTVISLFTLEKPKALILYQEYFFSLAELLRYLMEGCVVLGLVSQICYDSFLLFGIGILPFLYWYLLRKKRTLCERRKQTLTRQFREVILAVSSHLQAGFSLENAFQEAYRDICLLYGRDSLMAKELVWVLRRVDNNEALEQGLLQLAERSEIEDIREFAQSICIAKHSGGELRSIILRTATMIGDKQEVRREIETIMSEKRMEQRIMQAMPFVLIVYLSLTSPGFLDGLYHNAVGILLMTGCLIVYVLAGILAEKILQIEI